MSRLKEGALMEAPAWLRGGLLQANAASNDVRQYEGTLWNGGLAKPCPGWGTHFFLREYLSVLILRSVWAALG